MVLLRFLVAHSMVINVRIFAKHVRTKQNGKADALSRLDLDRFWKLSKGTMNQKCSDIPADIWPLTKIWKYN